ncbi:MAG: hypothetical protein LBF65_01050, partial [Holosporales bacterium]|nr:hypothetical protein [Holosporales bacterium]
MHLSNLKKIVLNIMLLTGSSSQRTEAAHPPKTLIEWQNEHDKSPDQSGKSISGMLYIQSNRHVNDLISTILDKGNYPLAEYALKTTGNGQYTLTKEGENEIPLDPRGLNWWLIAENISKAMDCIKNKQHFDIQVQKTDSADPAMVTAFKDINLYWEILHIGEYLTD